MALKDFARRLLNSPAEKPAASSPLTVLARPDGWRRYRGANDEVYNPSSLITRKGLDLLEEMRRDDQIKNAMQLKKRSVLAGGWSVVNPEDAPFDEGSEAENDQDWTVRRFVEEQFNEMQGTIENALHGVMVGLDYGFSVSEKVYRTVEAGEWSGLIALKAIRTLRPQGITFLQDEFGEDLGIEQEQANRTVKLPPEKMVVFRHMPEFCNPYGTPDLEAAYRAWYGKREAYEDLAIFLNRFGIPPSILFYPPDALNVSQQEAMKVVLTTFQKGTSALVPRADPNNMVLEFPKIADQVATVFLPAIDAYNQDMARALLVPAGIGSSPDLKEGSNARSQTHFDTFMLIVDALRREISELVNEQIIRPLVDLNFPNVEVYPQFQFNPLEDDLRAELVREWANLVEKRIVNIGPQDEAHLRQWFEMPENDNPQTALPEPPPPVNPFGGNGPRDDEPEDKPADDEEPDMQAVENTFGPFHAGCTHVHASREPNAYERQVDFAAIEERLTETEAGYVGTLAAAIKAIRDKFLKQVRSSFDKRAAYAGNVTLPSFKPVQSIVGDMLDETFGMGREDLRQEVLGSGPRIYWNPDQPRDEDGKWSDGGGSGGAGSGGGGSGGSGGSAGGGGAGGGFGRVRDEVTRASMKDAANQAIARINAGMGDGGDRYPEISSIEELDGHPATRAQAAALEVWSQSAGWKSTPKSASETSVYLELEKPSGILDDDGDDVPMYVTVRVSDHSNTSRSHDPSNLNVAPGAILLSDAIDILATVKPVDGADTSGGAFINEDIDWGDAAHVVAFSAVHFDDLPNVKPAAAVRFLKAKKVWITGVMSDDLTKQARSILLASLDAGDTLDATMTKLKDAFTPYVGDTVAEPVVTPARLETIVRTNVTEAYNRGRIVEGRGLGDLVTAFEFSGVNDARQTEVCRALDGRLFRADDPELDRLKPPLHFNALPAGTKVLTRGRTAWRPIEEIEVGWKVYTHKGRWRTVTETMKHETWPEEIVLHLDGGKTFVATDDHPILTTRGWVCAGDLTEQDEIICYGGPCKVCGKPTLGVHCSVECRVESTRVHRHCKACGVEIQVNPTKGSKNRLFCSKPCAAQALRILPPMKCRHCDEPLIGFWKKPIARNRRFCSLSCYHAYKGPTSIESTVQEWLDVKGVAYEAQKQFGRYTVDFFLPDRRLAIEVDGEYWHGPRAGKSETKRERRSDVLLAHGLTVVNIPESAVKSGRFAKFIEEAIRG